MKAKIGVIGSAINLNSELQRKSREVGIEIAQSGGVLLTGSSPGVPYEAVKGAHETAGTVVGISPASDLREHLEKYKFPTEHFDILIFTGFGLKGRNVIFTRTCDAVVLISGRIGTLNEFTIAYDEGKTIGVLEGTGGVSGKIREIVDLSGKAGGRIVYGHEPRLLIEKVLQDLRGSDQCPKRQ